MTPAKPSPKPAKKRVPKYVLLQVERGDDDYGQGMTLSDLIAQELRVLGLKAVPIKEITT